MSKIITLPAGYTKLLKDIRRQIAESKKIIENQIVKTYWVTGRSMDRHLGPNPPHGSEAALARRLSKDIGNSPRTLEQSLQFYRAFPKLNNNPLLKWSHYRVLMTIDSTAKRAAWAKRAAAEDLNVEELRHLVMESRMPKVSPRAQKLPQEPRGLLYHYRLVKVDYVNDAPGGIMLDCGFDNRIIPPSCRGRLVNKRIVRAVKSGRGYETVVSREMAAKIYTYKAIIERVVDGDTILANIDGGFGIWREEYLRLKGIDTPEMRNAGGLKAKRWVARELMSCPFVVIRTHKTDKFDRYLADVYYLPEETDPHKVAAEGKLLNQKLLDRGLAKLWK